jgi:hypothetical protein
MILPGYPGKIIRDHDEINAGQRRMTMSLPAPPDLHGLLVRTDYSDDVAWEELRDLLRRPDGDGFVASLAYVDDRTYDGLTVDGLRSMSFEDPEIPYVLIADHVTMADPEHPLLVVDLYRDDDDEEEDDDEDGEPRTFRAVPGHVASITANLEIGNMDFEEFADRVDGDGVFRGFREPGSPI